MTAHCTHCGEACGADAVEVSGHVFCCAGCRSVYDILQSHDMCTYYDLSSDSGVSQRNARYDADTYAVLDLPEIRDRFVEYRSRSLERLRFEIPSMHCASCVWLLDRLSSFDPGILASEVDFLRKTVRVSIHPNQTSVSGVAKLLSSLGYEPLLHGEGGEAADDAQRRSRLRTMYIRIGVAGFAAGNLMMISAAQYLASEGQIDTTLKLVFDVLSITLGTLVVLYAAAPWFRSAWGVIRRGVINLDVPVALGISALYGRSLYDILSGSGEGYLDAFAGLVLFLLVGKLFQQKAFDAVSFTRTYRSFFPLSVRIERKGASSVVPIDEVQPGDTMAVRNGEVVPCDAVLTSPGAFIDYSFVTGESVPVECAEGDIVHAGGKIVGRSARLTAVKSVSHSYLTSLWEQQHKGRARHSYLQLSDRFGSWFTVTALTIAGVAFLAWLPDWHMGVMVATAVLIIACPCALTLAAPITLGTAVGLLGRRGVYVRNSETMAELDKIQSVAFDKTGTLTHPTYRLELFGEADAIRLRRSIGAITANSTHPISRSLADPHLGEGASHITEVIGQGIEGVAYGLHVAVGTREFIGRHDVSPPDDDATTAAWIVADGRLVGKVLTVPSVQPAVSAMLQRLVSERSIVLVTGDSDRDASLFEPLLETDSMYFRCRPEDKVAILEAERTKRGRILMVGDGLNDAAAMATADASVAVTNGTSTFVPACDVILPSQQLSRLPEILKYASTMTSVIKTSLAFTIVYNVVGLSLAVTGILTPLLTAIMMPVSSLIVVGLSVGGAQYFIRRISWE